MAGGGWHTNTPRTDKALVLTARPKRLAQQRADEARARLREAAHDHEAEIGNRLVAGELLVGGGFVARHGARVVSAGARGVGTGRGAQEEDEGEEEEEEEVVVVGVEERLLVTAVAGRAAARAPR